MRLNSFEKIEKQAKSYADTQPPDLQDEDVYNKLLKEHTKLSREWDELRDKHCNLILGKSNRCNCAEHPRYRELMLDKLAPLTEKLNQIYEKRWASRRTAFARKHAELLIARAAKEKWMKTLQ